jgi:hypothetical protein
MEEDAMSVWQKIFQRLNAPELDVVFNDAKPPTLGDYQISNEVQNVLAHLAVSQGKLSRLIRGVSDGVLVTAPLDACIEPDGVEYISEPVSTTLDLLTARSRMVKIWGPFGGTDLFADMFDADTVGGADRLIGVGFPYGPTLAFSRGRYIEMLTLAGNSDFLIKWWNLIPDP